MSSCHGRWKTASVKKWKQAIKGDSTSERRRRRQARASASLKGSVLEWFASKLDSLQDCLLKKAWVPMQFNQFKLCAADMLQFPSDTIKWMTSHGTVKPRGRVDRDPIYLLVGRHCRLGTSANSSHQGPLGLEECAMIVLISYNKKAGFPQIRWCFASLLLLNQRSSYTIWKQCLMPNKQVTRSNQVQSVCRSGTIYLFCI